MTLSDEDLEAEYTSESEFNLERVVPNDNKTKYTTTASINQKIVVNVEA